MDCARTGYSTFPPQSEDIRTLLRIELVTGDVGYVKIMGCTLVDETTERFTLSESLYAMDDRVEASGPAFIAKVSFMDLMRCAQDLIEIVHETDIEGLARCAMTFITAPALRVDDPLCPPV